MKKLLGFLIFLILLGGVFWFAFESYAARKLEADFDLAVESVTPSAVDLTITLRLTNPTPIPLTLIAVSLDIFASDQFVGAAQLERRVLIPGGATRKVPLSLRADSLLAIKLLTQSLPQFEIPIELQGEYTLRSKVFGIIITEPITVEKTLELRR